MSTELAISNEELLAATGEDQQQGGNSIIKYIRLVQEVKNGAAERYGNLIALEKDATKKKELQAKMLDEMEKEIKVGCFSYKNGQDEFGNDIFVNLGNPFITQILKVRYSWATKYGNANPMYTSEVDTVKGIVKIFKDKQEIDMLPGEMIKAKYPDLKRSDVLYLYDKDTKGLWKLSVKGGSLTGWFDFCKTFPPKVSKSSFETIIGSKQVTDPTTGKLYQAMTFARGSQIEDMRKTLACIHDLNAILGTTRVSKNVSEEVLSFEDAISVATGIPKSIGTVSSAPVQATLPKTKERNKMVDEAIAKVKSQKTDMTGAPEFLQPDKE